MKKTWLLGLSLALLFIGSQTVNAQTEDNRFAASIMGGKTEYIGDYGFTPFDFNQFFYWNIGGKLSRYMTPYLNVSVSLTYGDIGFNNPGSSPEFWADLWHVYATAEFNFANDFILPADFIINPYVYAGAGIAVANEWTVIRSHPAFTIPVGVGAEVRILDNLSAFWQTGFNFTTSDQIDLNAERFPITGLDQFWTHQLGVKYSFDLGF